MLVLTWQETTNLTKIAMNKTLSHTKTDPIFRERERVGLSNVLDLIVVGVSEHVI